MTSLKACYILKNEMTDICKNFEVQNYHLCTMLVAHIDFQMLFLSAHDQHKTGLIHIAL